MCTALPGFFGQDRQHIRHLVQNAGGTYSGDLLLDHTTHLVYKELDLAKRGEKYGTALSWGIPVLPFTWLQDSAQCRSVLPDTYKPVLAQAADESPATKMQQLHLQDDRPCHITHTAGTLKAPNLQHTAEPQIEAPHSPLDIASQVRGQHTVLHSTQTSQHTCLADDFDVYSCIGSCKPDLSDALLTQSPDVAINLADESGSDTCSDHCSPAQSVQELSDASSAPAKAAAAVAARLAHGASPQSSTHDIILPDSQPDGSATCQADQHLMAELPIPGSIHSPSQQSPGTIPNNPLEVADQPLLAAKHPQACSSDDSCANAVCSAGDSWQACERPGQQPATSCLNGDDAVNAQQCEAIPDTEMQGPLSSTADMHIGAQLRAGQAGAASISHASLHLECQHAGSASLQVLDMLQKQQLQQQQQQQQQQQEMLQQPQTHEQHEPDRLSFAGSAAQGSPSTSCASGIILEDSDDESDFQACKPARPSTASSCALPSAKVACHRCVHLDVSVPTYRKLRFLKSLTRGFATGWCSSCADVYWLLLWGPYHGGSSIHGNRCDQASYMVSPSCESQQSLKRAALMTEIICCHVTRGMACDSACSSVYNET